MVYAHTLENGEEVVMAEGCGEQQDDVADAVRYLIEQISDAGELERVEEAIARRRRKLGVAAEVYQVGRTNSSVSTVKEARPHEDGYLQAETRLYRRKDGKESERGPYWYFRYHKDGKQKKLYLGRTDDPEKALAEKRGLEWKSDSPEAT